MEFANVIKNRHATRKFKNEIIEKEKIEKILEAGRLAPTAKNVQPIKIIVVEKEINKMDNITPCRYNAPVILIVCGDKSQAFEKNNHSTLEVDASIVATHMMLETTNQGLGNIWIELFDREALKKEFSLPENIVPVCLLPIGYEAEDCPASPGHLKSKNLDEIVEYH